MSFLNSEIVMEEVENIQNLQKEVCKNIQNFKFMNNSEKIEYIDLLDDLLYKQRIFYTRLSLSDDPIALEIKNKIIESVSILGVSKDKNVNVIFSEISDFLNAMKKNLTEGM